MKPLCKLQADLRADDTILSDLLLDYQIVGLANCVEAVRIGPATNISAVAAVSEKVIIVEPWILFFADASDVNKVNQLWLRLC